MGALYLASKLQECPVRMRDLINVYDVLLQRTAHRRKALVSRDPHPPELKYIPMSYFGNAFYDLKDALVVSEMQILKRLGFNVNVILPYGTLVNYLRLLGLTGRDDVCRRAWGYLNDACVFTLSFWVIWVEYSSRLQTPVFALYPVPTVISAAILLTTRHCDIALPSKSPHCWWTLFDAEWEDIWSVSGYILRLYRPRTLEEQLRPMGMISKRDVRKWLEETETS